MDAVEHGQSFTVTRDGYPIAELIRCGGGEGWFRGGSSSLCRVA